MPRFGLPPITGIAIGTLLGGARSNRCCSGRLLRREGFRYRPILDFTDPELREVLRLMGPGTLGLGGGADQRVREYRTSRRAQQQGAVSWLGYAFRLMYLPIGLFGVSIATAALPDISRHAAASDLPAMRRTVSRGAAHDADAQRAGDARADGPRQPDRGAAPRARAFTARPTRSPRQRR